jgi:TrbC/VIRB2 pilin
VNKKNLAFLLFIAMALFNAEAFAANAGDLNLGVTAWLKEFLDEVSGPWVYIFVGLAGIGALIGLIWNPGELGYVFKTFMMIIIVAALAVTWLTLVADATGTSAMIDSAKSDVLWLLDYVR